MKKDFYVPLAVKLKEEIDKRLKPIDTFELQYWSLRVFIESLGYSNVIGELGENNYSARGFIRDEEMFKNRKHTTPKHLSFSDACKLYNHKGDTLFLKEGKISIKNLSCIFIIPYSFWESAQQNKLVDKIKLQQQKNTPLGIKVQNHYVKLVD